MDKMYLSSISKLFIYVDTLVVGLVLYFVKVVGVVQERTRKRQLGAGGRVRSRLTSDNDL